MAASYIVTKPVSLYSGASRTMVYQRKCKAVATGVHIETGDILLHRPDHDNSLAVYRAQALVAVVTGCSPLSISALITTGMLAEIKTHALCSEASMQGTRLR